MSAAVTLALLFFLSVALNEQVTEGCRCVQRHPQQQFCSSDVVIRAKVTGKANCEHPGLTAYNIQTIQTFKQLDKGIQVIYTSQTSCGINLENGEYLLSGHVKDGRVVVNLCDLVRLWNSLPSDQKRYLSMRQKVCTCKIVPCTGASCLIKMRRKCLIRSQNVAVIDDQDALQSICLPYGYFGFCRWEKIATTAL
ncbi:metalloproteinase inhibitor 3-like [Onychostoma macrolepis]|uniref:metalloproteinase inhibitor 3-like n=1 Tax=Onychostoma macrolepis TaxID=369639 RepID=UPI00272C2DC9|nr:metalloproteinase inhibitor 3-like [Onychostoma macrolepis]